MPTCEYLHEVGEVVVTRLILGRRLGGLRALCLDRLDAERVEGRDSRRKLVEITHSHVLGGMLDEFFEHFRILEFRLPHPHIKYTIKRRC